LPPQMNSQRDMSALSHDSKPVRRTVGVYTHRPDGARPPRGSRGA
jgi:hypothetical protein